VGKTLMLYRNKKVGDINKGKWIGLGGKFEPGESPEQCLIREVREEAGVTLTEFKLRGIITFVILDDASSEPLCIFIYTASRFVGDIAESCDEGTLEWVATEKVTDLNLWEGDRLFWGWMQDGDKLFSARFEYEGSTLTDHQVTFY